MRQQSISLFCLWYSFVALFVENTYFHLSWDPTEVNLTQVKGIISRLSVLFYWSMFTFMRASYYLDYCFFVTCEIRKCESFNFVHFSRMSWLFRVPCNSMWALKSFHQFPGRKKKKVARIFIGLHWICIEIQGILPS